jgi:hypothetical protein
MSDGITRGAIAPAHIPDDPAPFAVCGSCGCTPMDACLVDGEPCGWATPYLCTRCDSPIEETF